MLRVPHRRLFWALPVVPLGCPLVGFGLLTERFGMQLPGVLCSLPSRIGTVTAPKALLGLGRFLVQLFGAAVCGKLTCLRSRGAFPCLRHSVRCFHQRLTHSEVAV
jgi:hypothetical protein